MVKFVQIAKTNMGKKLDEQSLEAIIEKQLTGTCIEGLKKQGYTGDFAHAAEQFRQAEGYYLGTPNHYNAQYAVDELRLWHFLEKTQAAQLAKLQKYNDWKLRILNRIHYTISKYGLLHILRNGFAIDDAQFTIFYPVPLPISPQKVHDDYANNEFSVTRQLRYSVKKPLEEIDMVLFVNGLPFATMELKNPITGQNAKIHGQNQYRFERDNTQPLLQFGRCLVHFTADTEEVYMTTRLNGDNTYFLPFNLGYNYGKGNPPNPEGYKTE